jgi:hypothetical protein
LYGTFDVEIRPHPGYRPSVEQEVGRRQNSKLAVEGQDIAAAKHHGGG